MPKHTFSMKRLLPILLLLIALGLVFYFRLYRYLSFNELKQHRVWLLKWTQAHYWLAVLTFIGIYIAAAAISIPGATILTLGGGFLFGNIAGTIYVVTGASIGACIVFLATRYAFADALAKKAGPWLQKMEAGFQKNALNYLFTLRVIPAFPFWLVNIVAALFNVRFKIYLITTVIGIIPGSAVYVSIGNGLGAIFDNNETPNLGIIFQPQVLIPLVALGLLSLLPIIYKKLKQSSAQ